VSVDCFDRQGAGRKSTDAVADRGNRLESCSKVVSLIRVYVTSVFSGIVFACVVVWYIISVLWTGIGMPVEEAEIDGMNPRAHVATLEVNCR
jgi:hypothetical protein